MVMARLNPGGAPWAAQRFWISEKANSVCHNFPGFHKGGKYINRIKPCYYGCDNAFYCIFLLYFYISLFYFNCIN